MTNLESQFVKFVARNSKTFPFIVLPVYMLSTVI